ncbi:MAG: FAD-dependent oxidoreductase, partial [Synergistes sp.]|nr:FAD-dependent oxidoreductase [Synergistes sp.]
HKNIEFPGHAHASLYNVYEIEPAVKKYLASLGVKVVTNASAAKIEKSGGKVTAVITRTGEKFEADAFVDATGTSATPGNCVKYGNGCAMCIQRCHSFAPRLSICTLAGIEEWNARRDDGSLGAMSGACKLFKESLSEEIVKTLNETGVCIVPISAEASMSKKLGMKACQQYALKAFAENIILLDTGPAKLMTPFFPLDKLRKVPGFENARFEDPLSGGKGNSLRFFQFANCAHTLQAQGEVDNIFCAGEKCGAMVGHTEAIVTGSLAGNNAVRLALGKELIELPNTLAVGDFVNHVTDEMKKDGGRSTKFSFSGSVFFERMKELGLYLCDPSEIAAKVEGSGFAGIFAKKLCL